MILTEELFEMKYAEFVVKTWHESREESHRKSASEPRWLFKPKTKPESNLVTLSTIQGALPKEAMSKFVLISHELCSYVLQSVEALIEPIKSRTRVLETWQEQKVLSGPLFQTTTSESFSEISRLAAGRPLMIFCWVARFKYFPFQ